MRYLALPLLLAGCAYEADRMAGNTMTYGDGGVVELDAPIGQSVRLERDRPVEIAWAPVDRRALGLEVQVQIVDAGAMSAPSIPQEIRWQLWLHAHGGSNYDYRPNVSLPAQPGTRLPAWPMPARGLKFRVPAREVRMSLIYIGAPEPGPLLRWSIHPVGSATQHAPVWPQQEADAGYFPVGATEWRVFEAAVGTDIGLYDFNGVLLQQISASLLVDWTPIPLRAARWQALLASAEAQYR